ncbi:hypothetical protein TRL7639_01300 [Falsiruegeria litorea R37]|uniref:DUF6998 domain-containing protein n=1 Tax=Falsiruegeria litorea R37 TaxID=1200284 RepID=A0A1Y5S2I7_9RHOB|nr:hypothetical protein [Falsiruegeria litorea]SLN31111.1 hypothetical protein TRL7639_01300 [Falsiruegeria litorea R37]
MPQVLSQSQIIRSLAQALEWYEKEMSWGVSSGELNHLTGRIGELYAAMVTRGQMALETNQRGYDVVSLNGERISVKTVTTSTHVTFRASTFDVVQRVMILRIVVDDDVVSIEEILDCPADDIRARGPGGDGNYVVYLGNLTSGLDRQNHNAPRSIDKHANVRDLKVIAQANHGSHKVMLYENGSILVETDGKLEDTAKPTLRKIAKEVGVDTLNGAGNPKNTRTLGSDIIKALT